MYICLPVTVPFVGIAWVSQWSRESLYADVQGMVRIFGMVVPREVTCFCLVYKTQLQDCSTSEDHRAALM
eukprot:4429036-Amphidinium_carterae.1